MVKFFRHIRRDLMEKNKTGKYLKYAIGEIVLVVIGILIALSIKNWNTERIDSIRINNVLQSIHNEITKDTFRLVKFISNAEIEIKYNNKIRERVFSKHATLDTLVHIAKHEYSYSWISHFEYTNDSYEGAKSSGFLEKIPDSLKIRLTDYYDTQYYWINVIEDLNNQYRERFSDFSKTYSPLAPEKGLKREFTYINNINWLDVDPKHFNPKFSTLINARYVLWQSYSQELSVVQNKSGVLLEQLNNYLND